MKTITIPKRFGYPTLDVTVNGKEYTVKSGEETTLEDHIAEAIENAIALAPKFGRNVTRLGQLADGSISHITASDLGEITSLASHAFYKTELLSSIEIPDDVISVEACALYGCSNLESVRFGTNSKLDRIGLIVFDQCPKLSKVHLPPKPPTLENINAFDNINANCVFYCKTQESLEAYRSAPIWSTLAGTYTFKVEP